MHYELTLGVPASRRAFRYIGCDESHPPPSFIPRRGAPAYHSIVRIYSRSHHHRRNRGST